MSVSPSEGSRPRRRSPATPEQMAARRQDAEARSATQERKARTRRLIQLGGVAAKFGVRTPEQMAVIMADLHRLPSWRHYMKSLGVEVPDREHPDPE